MHKTVRAQDANKYTESLETETNLMKNKINAGFNTRTREVYKDAVLVTQVTVMILSFRTPKNVL